MAQPYLATGVIKGGEFRMRGREQFVAWAKRQRDGEYTVTFERLFATRSVEQNAVYWAGYVTPISEFTGYTKNEVHELLKRRCLPEHKRRVKKIEIVSRKTGETIDEYEVDNSTTTTLNKPEFSEFLQNIELLAAEIGVPVGSIREMS